MELLIRIDNYEEWACDDSQGFSELDKENVKAQTGFDSVIGIDLVNIGPGADFHVILLTILLGFDLIKLGADINDGIDGWIEIGKKIRNLFKRKKVVSVDEEGATALALELISRKVNIVRLEKLHESTINLADLSGMIPTNKGLSQKPYNYYIQTYRVNDDDIFVIGIKSTGEAKIIKHFWYNYNGLTELK